MAHDPVLGHGSIQATRPVTSPRRDNTSAGFGYFEDGGGDHGCEKREKEGEGEDGMVSDGGGLANVSCRWLRGS